VKKEDLSRFFPFFLILYEFSVNMSNDMYLPALPMIASEFSLPLHWIQLTITAWFAGDTSFQLIAGPLTDRFGRRPILLGGGLLFLLATLGCALSYSLTFLIIFRFLQGISVCTMLIAGYASIHDLYNDEKAIHILVWMTSAAVIAPAVGPVLGGLILLFTGWRTTFLFLFFLAISCLIILWRCMPESIPVEDRHPLRIKNLISVYKKLFSNFHFMISAVTFGFVYGGITGWVTIAPFILMKTLGLSPPAFGAMQIPVFGSYILGAQCVKPLMKRMSKERLVFLGLLISSIAGIGFIFFPLFAHRTLSFIIPISLFALGFGFTSAPLNRMTLMTTIEKKGSAMAVFYLIMVGSGTLISLILSLFKDTVFFSTLAIGLTGCIALILNRLRMQRQAEM
jgi:MFS transporter, DHA1 family, multidrug resistance protein